MKLIKFYFLLFCLTVIAQTAFAQSSPTLNIQGVLRNANTTAVDNGIYKIKFSLYTTETGGTPVWSETQDSVVVSGGVYSTSLGKNTPMTAAFDQNYYLGVKVGAGAEMTPRAQLSSAPYALSLIGQGNTFPSTGAVGVGTNAPTAGNELHVKDASAGAKVTVEGATTSKIVVQSATGSSIDFKKGANTASISYDGTNIIIDNLQLAAAAPRAYVFCKGASLTINHNTFTTIPFTEVSDAQNAWDGNTFTAPRTGVYHISGTMVFSPGLSWAEVGNIQVVLASASHPMNDVRLGFVALRGNVFGNGFARPAGTPFSGDIYLTAGQTFQIKGYQSSNNPQSLLNNEHCFLTITEY